MDMCTDMCIAIFYGHVYRHVYRQFMDMCKDIVAIPQVARLSRDPAQPDVPSSARSDRPSYGRATPNDTARNMPLYGRGTPNGVSPARSLGTQVRVCACPVHWAVRLDISARDRSQLDVRSYVESLYPPPSLYPSAAAPPPTLFQHFAMMIITTHCSMLMPKRPSDKAGLSD